LIDTCNTWHYIPSGTDVGQCLQLNHTQHTCSYTSCWHSSSVGMIQSGEQRAIQCGASHCSCILRSSEAEPTDSSLCHFTAQRYWPVLDHRAS